VFALAAVPALLSVLVLVFKVRDTGATTRLNPEAEFKGFSGLGNRFYAFLVIILIFTLGNATDAFLLVRAQELSVPLALVPILWGAFHVSKMFWNIVGGRLADRIGPRPAIIAGWLVYALTYAGFAFASAAWQVWALFGVYGLFYGLTEAPEKALVAAVAPAAQRGAAFGAYHFSIGLGALPASVMFGLIWQRWGAAAAFLVGAGLSVLAAIGLLLLRPAGDPKP
jgi:MFS family permease